MKKLLTILLLCVAALALTTGEAYAYRKVTVQKEMDLVKVFAGKDTKFVIKEDIDLGGKTVKIGEGCMLVFKGGSLANGKVVGNNTKMGVEKDNVFHNCEIQGEWLVNCAFSTMFDADIETMILLRNMSCLSPVLKLSANRHYHINANDESLNAERIESADKKRPLLSFHTTLPNVSGIRIIGESVTLKNLIITDDYDINNDAKYGANNVTLGNTIAILSPTKTVNYLTVEGCSFMGGTSSSFVAASQVRNCTVTNCDFSGYMADHAVYCSMKVENYNVYNCRIRDVVHTSSLFKVRDSKGLKRFNIIDVKAHNLNGYLADLTALESPQAELLFQGIRVTKDSGNQSIFYGFCLSDNANGKSGDSMNVRGVLFKNNQFDYGYGGNPLINSGSGKRIRVEEIRYENVKAKESNFGGGNVDRIIVDNCTFDDCCGKIGIYFLSKELILKKTKISCNDRSNCLLLLNYDNEKLRSITMSNVDVNMDVINLLDLKHGDNLKLNIDNCKINKPTNTLINTPKSSRVLYKASRVKFR